MRAQERWRDYRTVVSPLHLVITSLPPHSRITILYKDLYHRAGEKTDNLQVIGFLNISGWGSLKTKQDFAVKTRMESKGRYSQVLVNIIGKLTFILLK